MSDQEFAIGMIYTDTWSIYYGDANKVESFVVNNLNRATIRYYKVVENMERQLNYYKKELSSLTLHRIEDIVRIVS